MKITFVRPNLYADRSFDAMQPLCFALLKAMTPPDVATAFYDERLEAIPLDEPTDLVAMTVETYTARRAYQIAEAYRRRGVPVVLGGYHPTFLPEEALQFADAVVVGDAEGIWPRVVEDARRGRLQPIYRQDGFPALGGTMPDRSIFKGKRYAPLTLVQYGRGCKYNCSFCSIHAFYGTNLRQRPIGEVVAEIKRSGARTIFLVDDNIFVDVPRARALFEALIPLRIAWSCQVSIDVAHDPALVRLMARSGCINALVGFESLNRANLTPTAGRTSANRAAVVRAVRVGACRRIAVLADDRAPAAGNLVTLLRRELVAVRLVPLEACQVLLEPRPVRVKAPKAEVVVELPHLGRGIADQVFVTQLVELSRREQALARLQPAVEPYEGFQHVFLEASAGRLLQTMRLEQRPPQVDR